MKKLVVCLLVLVLLVFSQGVRADIVNGTFDTDLSGWTVTSLGFGEVSQFDGRAHFFNPGDFPLPGFPAPVVPFASMEQAFTMDDGAGNPRNTLMFDLDVYTIGYPGECDVFRVKLTDVAAGTQSLIYELDMGDLDIIEGVVDVGFGYTYTVLPVVIDLTGWELKDVVLSFELENDSSPEDAITEVYIDNVVLAYAQVAPQVQAVTYDGDTYVSTDGNPTAACNLVATLWDGDGNVLTDLTGTDVTFDLSGAGVASYTASSDAGVATVVADLAPGIYTIDVTVADSDATATATLEVYIPIIPVEAVTYDGDTLVSTEGCLTASCNLIATLRNDLGDVLDLTDRDVTFTLSSIEFAPTSFTEPSISGVSTVVVDLSPGIYTIDVTVADSDATASAILTVYNPDGGFVTGGGWLVPEDNGVNTHPSRCNYGFNCKYKKDGLQGHLEFRYSDGFIDVKSWCMDSLVIYNETVAQFTGRATVNHVYGYTYLVTVYDISKRGDGDKFEIIIWGPDDFYHVGGGDICNGNIVIHSN